MGTLVLFQCGDEVCAVRREHVARIVPMPSLSRPPTIPPIVIGFMNLAGRAVPVMDAARIFGIDTKPADPLYKHVIVLSLAAEPLGLLVERVTDVRATEIDGLRSVANDVSLNGCVEGDFDLGGASVHLLDADRIFTAAERIQIEDLRSAEQHRLDQWAAS